MNPMVHITGRCALVAATPKAEAIRTDDESSANVMRRIALQRWADPDEIAGPCVAGRALAVDGRMVM